VDGIRSAALSTGKAGGFHHLGITCHETTRLPESLRTNRRRGRLRDQRRPCNIDRL
jgi:hypothetical protein